MLTGYILLAVAIAVEIFATSMLKLSVGFTRLVPSVVFVLGMSLSFFAMGRALLTLPLSVAYAVWAGVGTALTALMGVLVWKEELSMTAVVGIGLIVAGVVILNLKGAAH
ncbi:MAG: multidrug efflux SMR transporter [Veillonella sp.]|uniref:DMT family transporter n=1 Tax=Veillonella sp. TaxID=1926307 RepID=UPI0025EC3BFD|nr:multidrug efflux SMR transporter [Veillonella sp.]MBS4913826.1 multidrug efflux SMR transporter [Veillonella sp.]